jgi:hypothetical protein
MIGKERNKRMFDNVPKMAAQVLTMIEEADSWVAAGFRSLAPLSAAAAS